jgi:hypothetical protein
LRAAAKRATQHTRVPAMRMSTNRLRIVQDDWRFLLVTPEPY